MEKLSPDRAKFKYIRFLKIHSLCQWYKKESESIRRQNKMSSSGRRVTETFIADRHIYVFNKNAQKNMK